jgi:hypothetical protein
MVNNRFFYKVLLLCVLLLSLVSCAAPKQQASINCKYILETGIEPTTFNGVEKSEIADWILQRYPIESSTIEEHLSPGRTQYVWRYNAKYTALFANNEFTLLQTILGQKNLSGGDFITCLGEPDFYTAEYTWQNAPLLAFCLWYVDEGIRIQQVHFPEMPRFQTYSPEIDPDSIFPRIIVSYIASDTIEDMVSTFYNPLQESKNNSIVEQEQEKLKPWEGWESLQIQTDPILQ